MDRRHLLAAGGILVVLVVASGALGVVAWDADLHATDRNLGSADRTTVGDLSPECRQTARSLAASETVSIEEYRIGVGSGAAVVVRHTADGGWTLGSVACTPRLRSENNLHVEDRSINVLGSTTTSSLHRTPAFGGVRILCGVVGIALLAVGVTRG